MNLRWLNVAKGTVCVKRNQPIRGLYSITMFREAAKATLPQVIFDFVDGGAEDERTLRANEAAFSRHGLVPKPLNGAAKRDQSVSLFGKTLSLPVAIGPTGLAGMLWPEGEICGARAAAAAGTAYCLSHGSTCTIEQLAALGVSPRWMQVFMYRDRDLTRRFAERAASAGYDALVLTVDNQVLGQRERDLRNGFSIPPRASISNALDFARRLPWLWRMRGQSGVTFANYREANRSSNILSLGAYIGEMLDPAASWSDITWLRGIWTGPLILKGILHPQEALRAIDHGIDGLIVSNHGGRQLDGAQASARALPAIAMAIDGRIPVLVDGGIRRGSDVIVARALGATACLIARPHLWGLTVAGEAGVAAVLEIFRSEIDRVMALGGWSSLDAVTADALAPELLDAVDIRRGTL